MTLLPGRSPGTEKSGYRVGGCKSAIATTHSARSTSDHTLAIQITLTSRFYCCTFICTVIKRASKSLQISLPIHCEFQHAVRAANGRGFRVSCHGPHSPRVASILCHKSFKMSKQEVDIVRFANIRKKRTAVVSRQREKASVPSFFFFIPELLSILWWLTARTLCVSFAMSNTLCSPLKTLHHNQPPWCTHDHRDRCAAAASTFTAASVTNGPEES